VNLPDLLIGIGSGIGEEVGRHVIQRTSTGAMPVRGKRFLLMTAGGLTAVSALLLSELRISQEPTWLMRMNEFEHLVFHVSVALAGFMVGALGLGALLSLALRMWKPSRRSMVRPRTRKKGRGGLRPGHLAAVAVSVLAILMLFFAKRHLIEPLWLTDVTPFEHFLMHVGLAFGGVILGACGAAALVWSLLKFLDH
jgi:hypothetical protein